MILFSDPYIVFPSCIGLGLLLVASAIHKLRTQPEFAAVLDSYGLVAAVPVVQKLIPLIELLTGCALLVPAARGPAAASAALIFLMYGAAMGYSLLQGKIIADCGCSFGPVKTRVSTALIWRNLVLAGVALNLTLGYTARPLGVLDILAILMLTKIAAVFYLLVNSLISNQLSTWDSVS